MTGADIGATLEMACSTISKYARQYEKENDCLLPKRGTIHYIGRCITHKPVICRKVILEGKSIEETARETNHSPEGVTRYVVNLSGKRLNTFHLISLKMFQGRTSVLLKKG
ncbi:MAG: DUF1670 domain-containing protein [Nitrospinota bacterium]